MALIPPALSRAGFTGISDDDPSRSLIAWDFARHPHLDPTHSSWLPVHTYLAGTAMALTGELRKTSRAVSLAGALACALLAVTLARRLGSGPVAAAGSTLAALAFPWSAFCAAAPGVPELPGTAFLLAAVVLLARSPPEGPEPRRAALAGAALTLACGHRYEAWFASAGACLYATVAWRARPRAALAFVGAAAVVPLAWLAVNHARSGDALEFLHRVEAYRAAHEPLPPLGARVARFPLIAASHAGLLLVTAAPAARRRNAGAGAAAAAVAGVLAGLVVTDARGGGPTHHPARALVPCVWLAAPLAAAGLSRALRARERWPGRVAVVAGGLLAAAQLSAGVWDPPREVSPDTLAAGHALAASGGPYLVEIERLDFLWAEWASGHPERARPDRPFGGANPPPGVRARLAAGCVSALVSTDAARNELRAAGWRDTARFGAWTLLAAADARGGGAR